MSMITFRFYGELNDFLSAERRQQSFTYPFTAPVSIKHLIEALGVPHTEVELILANDISVDFGYWPVDGDRLAVYPAFTGLDVTPLCALRPSPPHPPRFILDIHLGQLARYLRLLGFDTLFPDHHHDDQDLAELAASQNRILLTRDRGLLKRSLVTYGYCLRHRDPLAQLRAVLHRYNLYAQIQAWPRCLRCNGQLHPIAKEAVWERLEPRTRLYYDEFQICQTCQQLYWKGSHYAPLQTFLAQIRREGAAGQTNLP